MRRVALLLCSLTLAACAPATRQPAVAPPVLAAPDGATLRITDQVLYFNAGALDALDLTVLISGGSLRVNAPQYCKAARQTILCLVPRLPAGGNFVLPMRGSNLSVVATYKRTNGQAGKLTARGE